MPIPYTFPGRKITLIYPTPLILGIYLNRPEIVDFLIGLDADIDIVHKPSVLFFFLWTCRNAYCRTCE